jgi:hypothetical protein
MPVTDTYEFEHSPEQHGVAESYTSTYKRWKRHYESLEVPSVFATSVGAVAGALAGVTCAVKSTVEAGRSFLQELGDPDEGYTGPSTIQPYEDILTSPIAVDGQSHGYDGSVSNNHDGYTFHPSGDPRVGDDPVL